MSSLHKFAEDYWKSCFLSHLNRIHACHVEVIILDTVISSFVFSYMVKRSLLRLCDCRWGSAVPVLSINISFMGYILCNKSVMFKPEFQDIKKGKKRHKVKFLAQETWKPYCRINNFSKLCLLESKIEQIHENDKRFEIWEICNMRKRNSLYLGYPKECNETIWALFASICRSEYFFYQRAVLFKRNVKVKIHSWLGPAQKSNTGATCILKSDSCDCSWKIVHL